MDVFWQRPSKQTCRERIQKLSVSSLDYVPYYCFLLFCDLWGPRHLGNTSNTTGRTTGHEANLVLKLRFHHYPKSQLTRISELRSQ